MEQGSTFRGAVIFIFRSLIRIRALSSTSFIARISVPIMTEHMRSTFPFSPYLYPHNCIPPLSQGPEQHNDKLPPSLPWHSPAAPPEISQEGTSSSSPVMSCRKSSQSRRGTDGRSGQNPGKKDGRNVCREHIVINEIFCHMK